MLSSGRFEPLGGVFYQNSLLHKMQNHVRSEIASSGFAAVRVFSPDLPDAEGFASELQVAGFVPFLGFMPPDGRASDPHAMKRDSVPSGSVIIIDAGSLSFVQSCLQLAEIDLSSLYLVVLAHGAGTSFEAQTADLLSKLSPTYRRISVLPSNAAGPELAREAAAVVRTDRTEPENVLLWIIEDHPYSFGPGGCWADLAEAANSTPRLRTRLRVVRSLVEREAVMGHEPQSELVSIWRREILEPAARNGTRVVLVTRGRSSGSGTQLGEAWASTVREWLPSSTTFIASAQQVDHRRRSGEGILIWDDDRLSSQDKRRILDALSSPPPDLNVSPSDLQADPTAALSSARVRAVALSSDAFRAVWPDLLALDDSQIRRRLHETLTSRRPLDPARREALWEALGWNKRLAERLAAAGPTVFSRWVAGLPEPRARQAALAWLAELGPEAPGSESPPQTPSRANGNSRGDHRSGATPSTPPPVHQATGGTTTPDDTRRFTFLSVMDEWSSRRGGLSTFNRELCLALARGGHRVQCLVIYTDDAEVREAKAACVDLCRVQQRPGNLPLVNLHLRTEVPHKPDFILGHGRVTGPAAHSQAEHYPGGRRIHFVHMSPEAIEPSKAAGRAPGDFAALAYERAMTEVELSRKAALVVAVGPRLYREVRTRVQTFRPRPRVHRLDPGITSVYDWEGREPPDSIFCLLSGRVEDYHLKGVDIAAAAAGRLAERAERHYGVEITLVVRGVEPGQDTATLELVQKHAGPHLADIRIRSYVADRDVLARDLMEASVVLMPSREEGFGLAGLEAIAAGTPVLLTSRSGLAEWLRAVAPDLANPMIVPTAGDDPENVSRWENAIDAVLSDREGAFERAAKLRSHLDSRCTWDSAASALVKELARLDTAG